jgi:hypothetical protein
VREEVLVFVGLFGRAEPIEEARYINVMSPTCPTGSL